ncbi:MobC family plasmid mobilization relaxosome protein [bacterium]|nr:MobC family plasmid mobilization relaxosome protein [bacterium]
MEVTLDAAEKMRDLASDTGRSVNAILVKAVSEIVGDVPTFFKDDLSVLTSAIVELNAVGRNLNQLARLANKTDSPINVDNALLRQLSERISSVSSAIMVIANRQHDRWKQKAN